MPKKPPSHCPPRPRMKDDRPSAAKRGYGRKWRALRLAYLMEHPLCQEPGCRLAATDVDHRVSKAKGGTDDVDNLVGYCHGHHSAKTCREDGGLRR